MNLSDRLLAHDAWTTQQLLLRCQTLSDAELDQIIDIGHQSARATLLHIIRNMEIWADLMSELPIRNNQSHQPDGQTVIEMMARLKNAAADLAKLTTKISQQNAWDKQWTDHLDDPPKQKTYGAGIAHIITHSMHHRAQLLYILRRLGQKNLPKGDVFSWENNHR